MNRLRPVLASFSVWENSRRRFIDASKNNEITEPIMHANCRSCIKYHISDNLLISTEKGVFEVKGIFRRKLLLSKLFSLKFDVIFVEKSCDVDKSSQFSFRQNIEKLILNKVFPNESTFDLLELTSRGWMKKDCVVKKVIRRKNDWDHDDWTWNFVEIVNFPGLVFHAWDLRRIFWHWLAIARKICFLWKIFPQPIQ